MPRTSAPAAAPLALLALLALLASHLPRLAASHGMMCEPRQRGAYHSRKCRYNLPIPKNPETDYCAHCLNGGTVATVSKNMYNNVWKVYDPVRDFRRSANRSSICGDPKGGHDHMIGGVFVDYPNVPIVSVYKQGGFIDFTSELDTNHNGYFDFYVCDIDRCSTSDISGKCFQEGACVQLMRVKHDDCESPDINTDYECGPVDPDYPGRWYLPCRNTGHTGVHIVGGPSGTMRYQLPEGFHCKHCVVHWYWATANSCAPRGFLNYFKQFNNPFGTTCESDGGGRGAHRKGMAQCGGALVPEEFWSCADVQITADGKPAGKVRAVPNFDTTAPPPREESNDGEEAQDDPAAVINKAATELENHVNMTANEKSGERKRDEERAAAGECLLEDDRCDGSVDCCNYQQVCVFTRRDSAFTCRFWWSLWKDVEDREDEHKAKKGKSVARNALKQLLQHASAADKDRLLLHREQQLLPTPLPLVHFLREAARWLVY